MRHSKTNAKKLLIPGIIFVWTISSLAILNQWDIHLAYRYYTWVFTAQGAFLIFFLPYLIKSFRQTKKLPDPMKFFEHDD